MSDTLKSIRSARKCSNNYCERLLYKSTSKESNNMRKRLNKKFWTPVFNRLKILCNYECTDSEIIEMCIFHTLIYTSEKLEKLDNKTRREYIFEKLETPNQKENMLDFINQFNQFKNSGL